MLCLLPFIWHTVIQFRFVRNVTRASHSQNMLTDHRWHRAYRLRGPRCCCCNTVEWSGQLTEAVVFGQIRKGSQDQVLCLTTFSTFRLNSWMAIWEANKKNKNGIIWYLMTVSNLVCEADCKMMLSSRWMSAKQPRKRQTSFDISLWLTEPKEKAATTLKDENDKQQTNKGPLVVWIHKEKLKVEGLFYCRRFRYLKRKLIKRRKKKKNGCLSFCVQISASFSCVEVSCRRGRGAGREEPQFSKCCVQAVSHSQLRPKVCLSTSHVTQWVFSRQWGQMGVCYSVYRLGCGGFYHTMSLHRPTGRRRRRLHFPFSVRLSTPPPLQEVQFQRLVQGHEVAVSGDPPERHVVLRRETERQTSLKQHSKFSKTEDGKIIW